MKGVNYRLAIDKSIGMMKKTLKIEELCRELAKEGLITKDQSNNIMVTIYY